MQQKSATRSNRRREPRRSPKGWTKAKCRRGTLDLGKDSALAILDIGETGARLLVREAIEKNQEVAIYLECPNYRRPLRIEGEVMWCLEMADDRYCVGIQFKKRLPYIELTRLA